MAQLRLRDYRNYARLDAEFGPGFHVFIGDNAQGKTNLLEAIYLVATLRSFRGVGSAPLVRQGQKGYFIGANVVGDAPHHVKIYWSPQQRRLTLDGQPVRRLIDYLGTVRAVAFCSEDLLLVKGPARSRRRFLDLLLTQTQPGYLPLLQRYTQALRSRNALLRHPALDEAALEAFSRQLVTLGTDLSQRRRELVPALAPLVRDAYRRIAGPAEELELVYQPSVRGDFAVELSAVARRERACRLTLVGPHRDEIALLLAGQSAGQFASEGQKRTLAIALKMAQAQYVAGCLGSSSVLLIDDVLGELDVRRRQGFLPLLEAAGKGNGQVFMTCTGETWPAELGRPRERWEVRGGTLSRRR